MRTLIFMLLVTLVASPWTTETSNEFALLSSLCLKPFIVICTSDVWCGFSFNYIPRLTNSCCPYCHYQGHSVCGVWATVNSIDFATISDTKVTSIEAKYMRIFTKEQHPFNLKIIHTKLKISVLNYWQVRGKNLWVCKLKHFLGNIVKPV